MGISPINDTANDGKDGLGLLLAGALLGGLAWRADRRSWLVRSAVGINGMLLAGVL